MTPEELIASYQHNIRRIAHYYSNKELNPVAKKEAIQSWRWLIAWTKKAAKTTEKHNYLMRYTERIGVSK